MRSRPNRFSNLFYHGDWHSRLVSSLKLAKEGGCSPEIQGVIVILEKLLSESDECIHTVTVTQTIPIGMAPNFALECVRDCIDVTPAELSLSADGELSLTITARGAREHVLGMAKAILKCGVSTARAAIWVADVV